jgi:hypothetical protein
MGNELSGTFGRIWLFTKIGHTFYRENGQFMTFRFLSIGINPREWKCAYLFSLQITVLNLFWAIGFRLNKKVCS